MIGCGLEKEMATHSSTLAWKILWMEKPGGLQSMGSQRVGYDWPTSLLRNCQAVFPPALPSSRISRSLPCFSHAPSRRPPESASPEPPSLPRPLLAVHLGFAQSSVSFLVPAAPARTALAAHHGRAHPQGRGSSFLSSLGCLPTSSAPQTPHPRNQLPSGPTVASLSPDQPPWVTQHRDSQGSPPCLLLIPNPAVFPASKAASPECPPSAPLPDPDFKTWAWSGPSSRFHLSHCEFSTLLLFSR